MFEEIHNIDLRLDQIPSIESDYPAIAEFALTFDGNRRTKDIALFANKTAGEFQSDPTILSKLNLTELRTCLFYEQRRYHHFGEDPLGGDRDFINQLLLKIVEKVKLQQTG